VPTKPKRAPAPALSPSNGPPQRPAKTVRYPEVPEGSFAPADGILADDAPGVLQPSRLAWQDAARGLFLYHGDCLEVMDAIAAKHPGGIFNLIFADPPYFLSNGGITCHAGKMVKVDKGDWDKSRGAEENHNFNREWLRRCQALLKPHGSLWVSGTHRTRKYVLILPARGSIRTKPTEFMLDAQRAGVFPSRVAKTKDFQFFARVTALRDRTSSRRLILSLAAAFGSLDFRSSANASPSAKSNQQKHDCYKHSR
jgi:hypothetical protein